MKWWARPGTHLAVAAAALAAPLVARLAAHQPLVPGLGSYAYVAGERSVYGLLVTLLTPGAALVLSVVAGLLVLPLGARLLPGKLRVTARLLLIANPAYLVIFTRLTPLAFGIPLALLARGLKRGAGAVYLVAAVVSPEAALALLLTEERWSSAKAVPALVGAAAALVLNPPVLAASMQGSLALILIAVALLEIVARRFDRPAPLLLVLAAPFSQSFFLLAALLATPLVARMVRRLERHRWTVPSIRPYTFLLVGCCALFLLLSTTMATVAEQPRADLVAVLEHLPSSGPIYAERSLEPLVRATTDQPFVTLPREDEQLLLSARRLDQADRVLRANGIVFLLLTPDLERSFARRDEGLLFLLENSNRFYLLAERGDVQLWRYYPRPETI